MTQMTIVVFHIELSVKRFYKLGLMVFMFPIICSVNSSRRSNDFRWYSGTFANWSCSFSITCSLAWVKAEICGISFKDVIFENKCFKGSVRLTSILTAVSFLHGNMSALSSMNLVAIFVPHCNSNPHVLHPGNLFRLKSSLFFISLINMSNVSEAEVINHLPLPKFLAFSLTGSFTVFMLQFYRAAKCCPMRRAKRHVSAAVLREKPLLHTEKLLDPIHESISGWDRRKIRLVDSTIAM